MNKAERKIEPPVFPPYEERVEALYRSMVDLLDAIVTHERAQLRSRKERYNPYNPSGRGRMIDVFEEIARAEAYPKECAVCDWEEEWINNPVRVALKNGLHKLGHIIHHLGGDQLMEDLCDREWKRKNGAYRINIVDHTWDGIGNWHS
jgi:hypothetical protein